MDTEMSREGADWVSLKEAAELTGKSAKTMRRWAVAGRVLTQKDPRGRWFLRRQDLEKIEPGAEARGELVVLTETRAELQATFHKLAEDLAAASLRAGKAEGERDGLAAEVERLRVEAEQRADSEKDRRQRAGAETDAAKVERDRFAYEVEELRVTLKAEEDRRWWQRRRG